MINCTNFYAHMTGRLDVVSIRDGLSGEDHFWSPTSSQTGGCHRTWRCCSVRDGTGAGWRHWDPPWATKRAHYLNSALGSGCAGYPMSRESQRSHGISFISKPRSRGFKVAQLKTMIFFSFLVLWIHLQNVLINYCQTFSIFLISRTWGQQFHSNKYKSSSTLRKSCFQSKFHRA